MRRHIIIPGAGVYVPHADTDEKACLEMLRVIQTDPHRAFSRDPDPGHCCASAFVLSHDETCLAVMHHKKYDRLVQPGGHCDGNPDFLAVARIETQEELGLAPDLMMKDPFHVETHHVPAYKDIPPHLHFDVRFLFKAAPGARLISNDESHGVAWLERDRWDEVFPTMRGLWPTRS